MSKQTRASAVRAADICLSIDVSRQGQHPCNKNVALNDLSVTQQEMGGWRSPFAQLVAEEGVDQ